MRRTTIATRTAAVALCLVAGLGLAACGNDKDAMSDKDKPSMSQTAMSDKDGAMSDKPGDTMSDGAMSDESGDAMSDGK